MKKFLIKIVVNVLFFVGDILSKLPEMFFFYWHPLYTYLMCKSHDIQKKYLGGNSPWELEKECEIDVCFKRDYPKLAKAFEDAYEVVQFPLTEDERDDIVKKYFENLRRYPDDTKTSEPSHSDGSCQEKNDPESGTVSEGDREV